MSRKIDRNNPDKSKQLSLFQMSEAERYNFLLFAIVILLLLSAVCILIEVNNPNEHGSKGLIIYVSIIIIISLIISVFSYVFNRHLCEIIIMEKDLEITELNNCFRNIPEFCNSCKDIIKELYKERYRVIVKKIDEFKYGQVDKTLCKDQILSKIDDKDTKYVVKRYIEEYNNLDKFVKDLKEEVNKSDKI